MSAKKSAKKQSAGIPVTPAHDWRTTDEDEIQRRIQRARDEKHAITNLAPEHPVFSNFRVGSPSGMTYQVEIRDLKDRAVSCTCPGFPYQRPEHLQTHRSHPHLAETPLQRRSPRRRTKRLPAHRPGPRR